jgi:hypothetical protein
VTTVPVLWFTSNPDVQARGYWDQTMLDDALSGHLWRPPRPFSFEHFEAPFPARATTSGAVVVVPGRMENGDHSAVQELIDRLPWCLVIITSDEEGTFPVERLTHSNMRVWVQTPTERAMEVADFTFPEGYTPHAWSSAVPVAPGRIDHDEWEWEPKRDFVFAGQVTNEHRERWIRAAVASGFSGDLFPSKQFAGGMPPDEYTARLASAKLAPCPGGSVMPDTFRIWEALEAGCLPLVDAKAAERDAGDFWDRVFGRGLHGYLTMNMGVPFVQEPEDLPAVMAEALADWPANANRASAAWQRYKRYFASRLHREVEMLCGYSPASRNSLAELVTVIITTSPVPSHPSSEIIEETVASVLVQDDLAACEIIVTADGVRPELEHRRADYERYLRRLVWLTEHRWSNAVPVLHDEWVHQANTVRSALELVRTPLVLFVEHDTPLVGEIPWVSLVAGLMEAYRAFDVARLHSEARVLPEHEHLMLDLIDVGRSPVPLLRTAQWSQRPHLARTDYYRAIIRRYFGTESRTMIEDVMHGVLDHAWRERGLDGWREHRVAIYAPEGDMKRSTHLDGRGEDSKYEERFVFAYDGPTPEGAPRPTAER